MIGYLISQRAADGAGWSAMPVTRAQLRAQLSGATWLAGRRTGLRTRLTARLPRLPALPLDLHATGLLARPADLRPCSRG